MNKINNELNFKTFEWTFEWINQEHFFISPNHNGRRNIL